MGLVIGRFAPLHKGHQYMIEKALKEMDEVIILIYATDDIGISINERANWIKTLYPTVTILLALSPPDGVKYAYENGPASVKIQNDYILKQVYGCHISHVYHSTSYGESVANALSAVSCEVDIDRKKFPISGTQIRENPYANKEYMEDFIFDAVSSWFEKNKN